MRILYSHRIQSRDGQSVHLEELVNALREAGHEVLIVGPSAYANSQFGSESAFVALVRRYLPSAVGEIGELFYNVPAYLRLRRAADSFRPDMIYERYNLYYLAGWLLARRRRMLLYLEVNSPIADERSRYGGLGLKRIAGWLERLTWRSADRTLAVTGVLRDIIVAAGAPRERVEVVHNGVDPRRFAARPPHPDAAAAPVRLGFVGFVRAWHGLDAVIAAMAENRDTIPMSLTVVGDGPVRSDLEQQAADLGIAERVQFTGLKLPAEVPTLVSRFDIALQPLVVPYASPLKIFDYMAAGCAIVAPDQPNIREILDHEQTAWLFDPKQEGAVWQAIARLAADPELRMRLGAAARETITRRDYTWRGNAERVIRWARADLARRDVASSAPARAGSSA